MYLTRILFVNLENWFVYLRKQTTWDSYEILHEMSGSIKDEKSFA